MLRIRHRRFPLIKYFTRLGTPPLESDLEDCGPSAPSGKIKKSSHSVRKFGSSIESPQRHARLRRRLSILLPHLSHLPQDQSVFVPTPLTALTPLHSFPFLNIPPSSSCPHLFCFLITGSDVRGRRSFLSYQEYRDRLSAHRSHSFFGIKIIKTSRRCREGPTIPSNRREDYVLSSPYGYLER